MLFPLCIVMRSIFGLITCAKEIDATIQSLLCGITLVIKSKAAHGRKAYFLLVIINGNAMNWLTIEPPTWVVMKWWAKSPAKPLTHLTHCFLFGTNRCMMMKTCSPFPTWHHFLLPPLLLFAGPSHRERQWNVKKIKM